jgi:hypothetical protein
MVPVSLPCETFARGRSTCHQLRIVRGTRQDESASAALEQPLLSRWSRDGACALRCAKMKVERNRPPPGIPNLVASIDVGQFPSSRPNPNRTVGEGIDRCLACLPCGMRENNPPPSLHQDWVDCGDQRSRPSWTVFGGARYLLCKYSTPYVRSGWHSPASLTSALDTYLRWASYRQATCSTTFHGRLLRMIVDGGSDVGIN